MNDARRPRLRGIWSAAITPIDSTLSPDSAKAMAYYRDLLARGCDGLNLLGTTGEAMSLGVDQRLRFMEEIARSGLPMQRVMVGTGAASLDDAARLTRCAFESGFTAALIMPPFFFRDAGDDGVAAFLDALFDRVRPPESSVLLYNFPRMSGITLHPDLVDRIVDACPGIVAGIKDSSNDRALQAELLLRHPEFAIFPGSESYLLDAGRAGAAGCISGSVALWPLLARDAFAGNGAQMKRLETLRRSLDALPMIPAVRYLIAKERGDESWMRPMPPLLPLSDYDRELADNLAVHA